MGALEQPLVDTLVPRDHARRCGASREHLVGRLADARYAIDILKVQEIRSNETCTRLVDAPAHVRGVINLRGVIVPVIDLRLKLNQEQHADESTAVTIVVNVGSRTVGMVVDAVNDLERLTTNLSQKIWQKITLISESGRMSYPPGPIAQP